MNKPNNVKIVVHPQNPDGTQSKYWYEVHSIKTVVHDEYWYCDLCGKKEDPADHNIYAGSIFNQHEDEVQVCICRDCLGLE